MNKKTLNYLLILIVIITAAFIAYDYFISNSANVSEETRAVEENPSDMFSPEKKPYTEIRTKKLDFKTPTGIHLAQSKLYISGDSSVQIFDLKGNKISELQFSDRTKNVLLRNDSLFVLFRDYFIKSDLAGNETLRSEIVNDSAIYTAIEIKDDKFFVADAGNKRVQVFDFQGKKQYDFEGISGNDIDHGFIIPSAYFHLELNPEGELWVANPGMHLLQHYTVRGDLQNFWGESGMTDDGFSGCCNPAYFTIMSDGSFITSEKGAVRVKKYDASGNFEYVIAGGKEYFKGKHAPQPAVDEKGTIYLLDFDTNSLRIFKKN